MNMISFIIIGRNEGWKLTKCMHSIKDTITYNQLVNYEIIYVDSDSTDDSIERVKEFPKVKIYKITGDVNAAIARNAGAKYSIGDVLFFIDGDMEIRSEFLSLIFSNHEGLLYNFTSGNWINYYYNSLDRLLWKENYRKMKTDKYEKITGGFFLIKREKWDLVGGMNNKFKKSQDIDLGLRLAKRGVLLYRKKEIGVVHHTIEYMNKDRIWKDFLSMNHIYGRSLIYRNHLFNKHMYNRMFRNDYSLILLFLSMISLIFSSVIAIVFILFYFIVLLFRGKFSLRNTIYFLFRDLTVLLGFFFFFVKKKMFSVKKIK